MSEPTFAFFNLTSDDKRGLVYSKYLLDRLGLFLFAPRVASVINLPVIKAAGYHVLLPLGAGNLKKMESERQQQILSRSVDVAHDLNLPGLAVDRRLKEQFPAPYGGLKLIFGDHFIKALALAYIKRTLGRSDMKRVVIATDDEDLMAFMEHVSRFGVPLSVQTYHPARYEPAAYQLMYEKGLAVSTSLFNPLSWGKGDLVIVFDPRDRFMALSPRNAFYLQLGNNRRDLAPDLESSLNSNGIQASLHNLAPILELCLASGTAGACPLKGENGADPDLEFIALEQAASSLGLWDLFLDKAR